MFRVHFLLTFLYRACSGLPPINHMLLEHKVPQLMTSCDQHVTQDVTVPPTKAKQAFHHNHHAHQVSNGVGHQVGNGTTVLPPPVLANGSLSNGHNHHTTNGHC